MDLARLRLDLEALAGGNDEDSLRAVMRRIVAEVMELLAVNEDEVAIFLPCDGDSFRFAAPLALFDDGSTFPAKNSLTQKVYAGGAPLVNNNVKIQKPLSIYERAKISERNPRPIQKMLAVPVCDGAYRVGVLQVSRRGLAVREAGPDFEAAQVELLSSVADTVAPFVRRATPDSF